MADEEELSNVFQGRVQPRRKEGDLEVIDISLYNPDGTPFELPTVPEPPELEGWQYVQDTDMNNAWHSLGAGYEVRFRKRTDNMVECFGYLAPGAIGLVFYLPVSCRPVDTANGALIFPCAAYDGQTAQVSVQDDGQLIVNKFAPDAVWINIANVRFSTD
jgi:hypothetical protein